MPGNLMPRLKALIVKSLYIELILAGQRFGRSLETKTAGAASSHWSKGSLSVFGVVDLTDGS
jgi:hypothetical protein